MYDGDSYSLTADYIPWLLALYSEAGTGAL